MQANGTVKWYNKEKGFGFIKSSESEKDIFVHINDCEDELLDGQHVEFDLQIGPQGPRAKDVKVVPQKD